MVALDWQERYSTDKIFEVFCSGENVEVFYAPAYGDLLMCINDSVEMSPTPLAIHTFCQEAFVLREKQSLQCCGPVKQFWIICLAVTVFMRCDYVQSS